MGGAGIELISFCSVYYIVEAMAISYSRAGRPYIVADIDFSKDTELAFLDRFFRACADFRYVEIMGLSRAYGVSTRTVENWKYGITSPKRKGIAQQIIDWVEQGKPIKRVLPTQSPSDMLR